MSKLDDDLERYANEAFTKGDVKAGLKLLAEITGLVGLAGLAFTAITVWLPGLNIAIPTGTLVYGLKIAAKEYSDMDEADRKSVRAVASLLRGGVGGIKHFFS
ncbi:MAG: hypothetical protein ACTFAK_01295 [Candidatus Electronema sp. VV]